MAGKPKVVVTNRIFAETRALLERHADVVVNAALEPWSTEEVKARCADASGLMAFMTDHIDASFIAACPRLRVIGAALKGADNIDAAAAARAGVWLTIVPDLLTVPTAELAIGLTLAIGRNILAGDRKIRTQGFQGWRAQLYGSGLAGSTVGIVGFGLVGQAIAARLRGFSCRLLAYDERATDALGAAFADVTAAAFETLIAQSDYVILALPLTGQTQHLFNADTIARMKPGARLVNPARGSLVDEEAVADAIERGHLAGYAADVFECEDWARDDRPSAIAPRLLQAETATVFTPHIGSGVVEVRREIELSAARSIIDVLAGRRPAGALNTPIEPAFAQSAAH